MTWRNVASTYTWLEADTAEGRDDDLGEWAFDAGYRFDSDWIAGVNWRYDFAEAEPTRAGLRLGYENECVDVELAVLPALHHIHHTRPGDGIRLDRGAERVRRDA